MIHALAIAALVALAADEEENKNLAEPTDKVTKKAAPAPAESAEAPAASGENTRFEKDRVRSVQQKPYLKAGRASISLLGDLGLNDPFYTRLGGSARLLFHLKDSLAIGVRGAVLHTFEEDDIKTARANFQSAIVSSSPQWLAMGELEWAPLYGKVAVGGAIIQLDGFLLGGLGTVNTRSPQLAFEVGGGVRFVAKDWLAFTLVVQNATYADTPPGGTLSLIQNVMTLSAGFSVFVPFFSSGGGPG